MRPSELLDAKIAEPRRELLAKLAEVETTLKLVSTTIELRPRLAGILRWDAAQEHEQRLVRAFVELRDADSRMVLVGLSVICYGSLEKFLKDLIERSINALNSACSHISELPDGVLDENIYWTGHVLQTVKVRVRRKQCNYVELAAALGSCADDSDGYILNAECFTFKQGIMSVANIDFLLRRIGVSIDWDCFGRDEDIKGCLGERRTRDCSKAVKNAVDFLVRVRNVASHTGDLDVEMQIEDIRQYVRFLPAFCAVLVIEVGKRLDAHCG